MQWTVLKGNTAALEYYKKKFGAINASELGWNIIRLTEDSIKANLERMKSR